MKTVFPKIILRLIFVLLLFLVTIAGKSQSITITGIVLNENEESLPSAYIKVNSTTEILVADNQGKFVYVSGSLPVTFEVSFLGYSPLAKLVHPKSDTTIYFRLIRNDQELREVEVNSNRVMQTDQFEVTRMSTVNLDKDDITSIPALGGEADLIKVIQLLPGVSKGVEGSTDLFVRGGAADQNLVLLDGAPAYNTSHLFGFLSVFNPDVLQDVEYVSGAFPASTGGRLSSILTVNSRSNIEEKTQVSGNIGLLASRLMIRQPVIKEKLSFLVAGRRTYVDQVVKLVGETLPYHFYDFNAKIIYRPSLRDVMEFTHYSGRDILSYARARRDTTRRRVSSDFIISNSSQTFLWKKKISSLAFTTLSLYRTQFDYTIDNVFGSNRLMANSAIEDYGGKLTLQRDSLFGISWQAGLESAWHQVSPSVISTSGNIAQIFESTRADAKTALESSVFFQADGAFTNKWLWSAGLRYSSASVDGSFFTNPEPRLAIRYALSADLALKASYSRMTQYMHRVSSSAIAFPTDIWYPVTRKVRPQFSDQVSISVQHRNAKNNIFVSIEGYYKNMHHLVGYREGTNLFFNNNFEEALIQGKGRATGLEFLFKKEKGKFTGWLAYTLSRATRQYEEVNDSKWFYARYDRRHNGSVVINYQLLKHLSVSGVFEYISGSRFTPIIGQYVVPSPTQVGVELIPLFAPMNSVKLADTHRLDLSLKYTSKKHRKFQSEWFGGVYNVYNRAMPYGIIIEQHTDGSYQYSQPGLFGMLPFFGFGFKF